MWSSRSTASAADDEQQQQHAYLQIDGGDGDAPALSPSRSRSAVSSLSSDPAHTLGKRLRAYRLLLITVSIIAASLLVAVVALSLLLHREPSTRAAPFISSTAETATAASSSLSVASTAAATAASSSTASSAPADFSSLSSSSSASTSSAFASSLVSSSSSASPSSSAASSSSESSSALPSSSSSSSSLPNPPPSPSSSSSSSSSSTVIPVIPYPAPPDPAVMAALSEELDSSRDLTADPCNDWFRYACGGWVDSSLLPPNASQIIKGVAAATAANNVALDAIIAAQWPLVTPLYASCMDTAAVEQLGLSPIQQTLDELRPFDNANISSMTQAFRYMGRLRARLQLSLAFTLSFVTLTNDPRKSVLMLTIGGGYTAPGIANYIGAANISALLVERLSSVLQAVGDEPDDAEREAKAVIGFETDLYRVTANIYSDAGPRPGESQLSVSELAALMQRREEQLELGSLAGTYSIAQLQSRMPVVPFTEYLNASGLLSVIQQAGNPSAYTADETAIGQLNRLISNTPLSTILAWTRWQALNASVPFLSVAVRQSHLRAFLTPLTGVSALPDRHSFCRELLTTAMPDLIGRYFVAKTLTDDKRQRTMLLLSWFEETFERQLPALSWMDEQTRAGAVAKVRAVLEMVGGPDNSTWIDYSSARLSPVRLYDNVQQLAQLRVGMEWSKLLRGAPRTSWSYYPTVVNAAYSRSANNIQFPAGILTSPWWNAAYPMAVNLARIGLMMGHELTHGFDSNGRNYGPDGRLLSWFSPASTANFNSRAQCFVRQYSDIAVQGVNISGTLTLPENISDNGGIHLAFELYMWYLQQLAALGLKDPLPAPRTAPLSHEQFFYFSFAQSWCSVATDAFIANQVRTDVHSPAQSRVWAPLVNQRQFARAFHCPVGSRMNPPDEQRCELY